MIEAALTTLLGFIESMSYPGSFIMAMIESTFVPIGSEFTMIPAGYLVHQERLSAAPVFAASLSGSFTGSLVNYGIARHYGRALLVKHQKYFFLTPEKLEKMERFFERHGPFSIFIGRMTYGVRHYISFPAGLAKMDLRKFCAFTFAGDAIWVSLLLSIGYLIGGNRELLKSWLPIIKLAVLCAIAGTVGLYVLRQRRRKRPI